MEHHRPWLLALLMAAFAVPPAVLAHDDAGWIQRGQYYTFDAPKEHCCGLADCHKLTASEVKEIASGYIIRTQYPNPPLVILWPRHKTYASETGDYWACYTPGRFRCFFAPAGG